MIVSFLRIDAIIACASDRRVVKGCNSRREAYRGSARRVSIDWYELMGATRRDARLFVVCMACRSGLLEELVKYFIIYVSYLPFREFLDLF